MNKIRTHKRICLLLSIVFLFSFKLSAYAEFGNITAISDPEELSMKIDMENVRETDRKFKTKLVFESYDDSDDGFNSLTQNIKIGESEFALSNISNLKMADSRTPKRRIMETISDTFLKGDEGKYAPDNLVTKDGSTWKLTKKELIESEIKDETKDAVTTKRYIGVEKGVPVPQSIDYTFTDKETGESIHAELPLTDQTEGRSYWTDFEFPISISRYNATVFNLNGIKIRAEEPLINYASEFLDMLNLDKKYYQVEKIEWSGVAYERNGELCRDAIGRGKKYVTDIDAVYSGAVTLPHREGATWKCVYTEELDKAHSAIYTYTADAIYVSNTNQTFLKKLMGVISSIYHRVIEAVEEHPIIAAVQILLIAGLITLLISRRRKKCIYDDMHSCNYRRDCDSCPYYKTLSPESDEDI